MLAMKKNVGAAKMRPDSRTPRRLPKVMRAMNPSEIGTRHGARAVTEELSAALPAATDTATVSM
jgi:hypothetical protein